MPRLSVSQIELLQLQLMEMEPYRGEMEVPKEACQEGISGQMDSGLHNISRALATLTAEGLVESRLCHVRGAPKRRKAYFLTEKGLQSTRSLVRDLESRTVSLDDGRSVRNMTLAVALRTFEDRTGRRPKFIEFVRMARSADPITLEALSRTSGEVEVMFFGRPEVEAFEGRDAELEELSSFIRSSDASCALVVGIPGIGKSTLASKLFEDQMRERSAFWYTVHEWDSVQSVMKALGDFFQNIGKEDRFSGSETEQGIAKYYSPTVLSLRETRPVLFFDDVDRAPPNVSLLLCMLCDAVAAAPSSKMVLISRSVPSFLAPTNKFVRIELGCIDRRASSALASRWRAQEPNRAVEESGGHPLMLRLSCEIGTEAARGSIDDVLGEHFHTVLDAQEKDMLAFLSVIRLPLPAKEVPGFLPETVASLKRKGLVQEYAEGIAVHQVVRSYFISRIPGNDEIRMHRTAAEYCKGRSGDRWRLEEISQDIAAEDWALAAETLLGNGDALISSFPEETAALLSALPVDRLEPKSGARLSFLRGRLSQVLGRAHEASEYFELSLSLSGNDLEESERATVLEAYAGSLAEADRIGESLNTHRQALSYYESVDDKVGQIREWMGMGSTWRKANGTKEAMDAFQTALGMSRERGDMAAVAANLNNVALLEWESGDLKRAETDLKESISAARAAGDPVGEGIGQTNLADLYFAQLRERESENLRLESAETFRRAGDIPRSKKIKARWALDVAGAGRGGEAIEVLEGLIGISGRSIRAGRGLSKGNVDPGDISLLMALIEVYRNAADQEKASQSVDTLLRLAKELESKGLEAQAWMEGALTDETFGDTASALGRLKKAEIALRELGNSEGLGAVYLRSGMIRLQMGERDEALVDLREATRHAEMSGSAVAYAAALDELGEALGSVSPEGRECLERSRQLRSDGRMKATGLSRSV